MTLATYTWANQVRREIQTKFEALKNNLSENIVLKGKTIAPGEKIFTKVYSGRYQAAFAKNETVPVLYMSIGETSLSGGNKNRTILQQRTIGCYFIIAKDFEKDNLEGSSAAIEDTIDYYRARIVEVLNSACSDWVGDRISINVTSADDIDTIDLMNRDYNPPYYPSVIDASITLASGQL